MEIMAEEEESRRSAEALAKDVADAMEEDTHDASSASAAHVSNHLDSESGHADVVAPATPRGQTRILRSSLRKPSKQVRKKVVFHPAPKEN